MQTPFIQVFAELPTLPDSAEKSLKINQSFHDLMNKIFENLPDYENFSPVMLSVILNIFLIVVNNLPDCKMQMSTALYLWYKHFCYYM